MRSAPGPLPVAVLISGTGSNLRTLIEAQHAGTLGIEVCLVISNRAEAPGLEYARRAGIPFSVINRESAAPGGDEDRAVIERLREAEPALVILAGYMRIVGEALVDAYRGRMINLHPSLLPRYKGLDTYRRVIEAGDREHGASIHFVTTELDGGPVIAQASIPVSPDDTPESLARRLGPIEHRLLVAVVELFSAGRVTLHNDTVHLDGQPIPAPLELAGGTLSP